MIELGGKVVSLSDSNGTIHDPNGIDADKLKYMEIVLSKYFHYHKLF